MNKIPRPGLFLIGFLVLSLVISVFIVSGVQAREQREPATPHELEKKTNRVYDPAAFSDTWGIAPDSLINCDPSGDLLATVNPANAKTFHGLQTAACREQVRLDVETAALKFGGAGGSCGYSGLSGESNMVKVATSYYSDNVRYVYLRCGKKVGEIGPPSCNCSSANFRYTYTCKRPATVYITIPCR
jgi:hypothetical protein